MIKRPNTNYTDAAERLMNAEINDILSAEEADLQKMIAESGEDPHLAVAAMRSAVLGHLAKRDAARNSLPSKPQLLPRTVRPTDRRDKQIQTSDLQSGAPDAMVSAGKLRKAFVSLVNIVTGPPVESVQLGAAARHKATTAAPAQRSEWRSRFTLTWKHNAQEWSMEGRSCNDSGEVVLVCTGGERKAPTFITWKNSRTEKVDRFEVRASDDGRLLVEIYLSMALIRAYAVRDTIDKAEQEDKLPLVYFA